MVGIGRATKTRTLWLPLSLLGCGGPGTGSNRRRQPFQRPRSATRDGRQPKNEKAAAYSIFLLEKYTMAQTYAEAARFSADVNVSKNRKYWGIPAGFHIPSTKENEAKTKWRWRQS